MTQYIGLFLGILLTAVGIIGIATNNHFIFSLMRTDPFLNILHIFPGILLLYATWVRKNQKEVRHIISITGFVYMTVGLCGFISPTLFGLLSQQLTLVENLFHLTIGGGSVDILVLLVHSHRQLRNIRQMRKAVV